MQQANRCPNCGSPVGMGQRFCGFCGATQSAGCPNCGSAVEPGTRFCSNCGSPVGAGPQTGWDQQQPGWDQQQAGWGQQQQPGWDQQQAGWGQQQQPGWGQQQQPGWDQQQAGWGQQQQPGWGQQQQPGWGQQQQAAWRQPAQRRLSPTTLVVILIVLLIALGGFTIWQFGPRFGIDIAKTFSGTSSSSNADATKPVISDIQATTDHKSALITWTTDVLSSSQVEYGTTTTYGTLVPETPATDPSYQDPATGNYTSLGVTTHEVEITGLQADTEYHYRVKSKNKAGDETVSADHTFKTTVIPEETE